MYCYTYVYTQKNGAVSRVDKQFISRHPWPEHTLSAVGTVQVSHAYCWAVAPVYKMVSQQEKALCVLRFEIQICVYSGM
jgi:hypothetical protein